MRLSFQLFLASAVQCNAMRCHIWNSPMSRMRTRLFECSAFIKSLLLSFRVFLPLAFLCGICTIPIRDMNTCARSAEHFVFLFSFKYHFTVSFISIFVFFFLGYSVRFLSYSPPPRHCRSCTGIETESFIFQCTKNTFAVHRGNGILAAHGCFFYFYCRFLKPFRKEEKNKYRTKCAPRLVSSDDAKKARWKGAYWKRWNEKRHEAIKTSLQLASSVCARAKND